MGVSDYGGNAHGRQGGCQVSVKTCRSFRCYDCNKLTFVPRHVVARGRSIHCKHCGGATEETEASFQRVYGTSKLSIGSEAGENPNDPHRLQCPECKKPFRSETGLKLHLEDSHGYKKVVA